MDAIATRFRQGRQRGLSDATVGNLIAYGMGLPPMAAGWSARELAHIRFLATTYDADLDAGREGVVSIREAGFLPRGRCEMTTHRSLPAHPADHR